MLRNKLLLISIIVWFIRTWKWGSLITWCCVYRGYQLDCIMRPGNILTITAINSYPSLTSWRSIYSHSWFLLQTWPRHADKNIESQRVADSTYYLQSCADLPCQQEKIKSLLGERKEDWLIEKSISLFPQTWSVTGLWSKTWIKCPSKEVKPARAKLRFHLRGWSLHISMGCFFLVYFLLSLALFHTI